MISKELYDKVQAQESLAYEEYVQIIETAEEEKKQLEDYISEITEELHRLKETCGALKDEFNKVSVQRDTLIRVIEKIMREE